MNENIELAKIRLAKSLTEIGYVVIPLNGKTPIGREWQKSGLATLDELAKWIANKHNLGIVCGVNYNGHPPIVVLDRDDIYSGPLPETPIRTKTGGGGEHYYFAMQADQGNRAKIGGCLDVKGVAGQVVLPFSIHPDTGKQYEPIGDWTDASRISEAFKSLPVFDPAWLPAKPVAATASVGGAVVTPSETAGSNKVSDAQIISAARAASDGPKFSALWDGKWQDLGIYPSQSEADLALCSKLAFWCGADPELMDQLFRQSGLMRDKWNTHPTYQPGTIGTAIEGCQKTYDWSAVALANQTALLENVDFGESGGASAALTTIAETTPSTATAKLPSPKPAKKNNADIAISYALLNFELWHSKNIAWVTIPIRGHKENWRVKSSFFKNLLQGQLRENKRLTIGSAALTTALECLSYEALKTPSQKIYSRIVKIDGRIYIDLGTADWNCVEVSTTGWRILPTAPIKFRRNDNTGAMPLPVRGGSLELLRPYCACTDEGWTLIKGWLIDCFKGAGPYFVLLVNGVQGAAKSTLCKIAKMTVDPVLTAELCSKPKDESDLGIDCQKEHALAFDNVSVIPQWLSDAFCRVATGGGIKCRTLYSDDEQTVLGVLNPLCINGIPDFAESSDLLGRSLTVLQPFIEESSRRKETELLPALAAEMPAIFGGLLDLLVNGLANPIKLATLPRMADSAEWVTSCIGNNTFMDELKNNEQSIVEMGLAVSPICYLIEALLTRMLGEWEGQASRLFEELKGEKTATGDWRTFPRTPKTLMDQLRRDEPNLKSIGIEVSHRRTHGHSLVKLKRV